MPDDPLSIGGRLVFFLEGSVVPSVFDLLCGWWVIFVFLGYISPLCFLWRTGACISSLVLSCFFVFSLVYGWWRYWGQARVWYHPLVSLKESQCLPWLGIKGGQSFLRVVGTAVEWSCSIGGPSSMFGTTPAVKIKKMCSAVKEGLISDVRLVCVLTSAINCSRNHSLILFLFFFFLFLRTRVRCMYPVQSFRRYWRLWCRDPTQRTGCVIICVFCCLSFLFFWQEHEGRKKVEPVPCFSARDGVFEGGIVGVLKWKVVDLFIPRFHWFPCPFCVYI